MGETQVRYHFHRKGLRVCHGLQDDHKSILLGYDKKTPSIGLGHKKRCLEIILLFRMNIVFSLGLCILEKMWRNCKRLLNDVA